MASVLLLLGGAWPSLGSAAGEPSTPDQTEAAGNEPFGGYSGPLALGPGGSLWFTDGKALGRIDAAGTLSEVPLSRSIAVVTDITAGQEGDLWATGQREVDRITQAGEVTALPLPPEDGEIGSIATAKDGTLWLTTWARRKRHERSSGRAYVIRVRPNGQMTSFPLPGPARARSEPPGSIVSGPGGDLWFTDPAFGRVGRVTPNGKLTEFRTRLRPQVLAPDGARLWLVGFYGVGTIAADGKVDELRTGNFRYAPLGSDFGAVTGPEGDLWFIGGATRVMRLTPTGQLSEIRGPGAPAPSHISLGPGGSIWFSTSSDPINYETAEPLLRYQPGFPGIEVKSQIVPVNDGEVKIPLACGGSSRGCSGAVKIGFGHKRRVAGSYEVAAESDGAATIVLPAPERQRLAKLGFLRVRVSASVEGGVGSFAEVVLRAQHLPARQPGRAVLLPLPESVELNNGFVRAPDGTIWAGGDIGRFNRISPAGDISTLVVRGLGAEPVPIGFDAKGSLWFFEYHFEEAEPVIGRLSPGGKLSQVRLPPGPRPEYEATIGPAGEVWVARAEYPHQGEIDRIGPGGRVVRFPIGVEPLALTADRRGGVWFSESGPRIGHIGPDGAVRIFHIPHKGFVDSMALTGHGTVWFTHWGRRHLPAAIGRLSPDGGVAEYPVPHVEELFGISVESNGYLSFATEFPRGDGLMTPGGKLIVLRRAPPLGTHERTVALGGG